MKYRNTLFFFFEKQKQETYFISQETKSIIKIRQNAIKSENRNIFVFQMKQDVKYSQLWHNIVVFYYKKIYNIFSKYDTRNHFTLNADYYYALY